MEIGFMAVPAGALFRRIVGADELGDDLAGGRFGDAEVTVNEKITQSVDAELRISGFDMGKLGSGSIEHGGAPGQVTPSIKHKLFHQPPIAGHLRSNGAGAPRGCGISAVG
jgi:hypothetical protein